MLDYPLYSTSSPARFLALSVSRYLDLWLLSISWNDTLFLSLVYVEPINLF